VAVAETQARAPSSELGFGLRDRLNASDLVREAEQLLVEAISPELVLVAPPDEARRARALLPPGPFWPAAAQVLPIPAPVASPERRKARDLIAPLAFLAFCVVDTVAPFVFVLMRH
jgi:hypothetical protein